MTLERASELYDRISALPQAERGAALERVAASEPDVAATLRALLGVSEDELDGFLEEPPDVRGFAEDVARVAGYPERVGDFRLVRCVGAGGMGVVFEAQQDRPRRRVAVKLLRVGRASHELERRFQREAEILALLHHPSIAHVYDAGVAFEDGLALPWIAMEFVEGEPLLEHVRSRGLDLRQRVGLLLRVAEAVEHAHAQNVVHRDLKPANVLVEQSSSAAGTAEASRPKILDFGVARVGAEAGLDPTAATRTGDVLGTLAYMAPEQVVGGAAIDARADVYSLGAILYEALTGRRPIEVTGLPLVEAGRRIREQEPIGARLLAPSVPADLATILSKALAKEPERRYASAGALAADLGRFLAGEAVLARPPSVLYRASRIARRHRAASIGGSVALLGVVAAVVVSLVAAGRLARRADEVSRFASRASVVGALLSLEKGDTESAANLLADVPEERRGWEWRVLDSALPVHAPVLEVRLAPGGAPTAAFGKDGVALAVDLEDDRVVVRAIEGGAVARSLAPPFAVAALSIAADGGTVAALEAPARRRVAVWTPERAGEPHVRAFEEPVDAALVSAGGALVVGLRASALALLDASGTERAVALPVARLHDAQLAGDASAVAFVGSEPGSSSAVRAGLVETAGGAVTHSWTVPTRRGRVALAPDHERLAVGTHLDLRQAFLLEREREPIVLAGHVDAIDAVAWSQDGTRLAVITPRSALLWDPRTRGQRSFARLEPPLEGAVQAVLAPAGDRLIVRDGRGVRLVYLGPVGRVLGEPGGYVYWLDWSTDGRALMTVDHRLELVLWDAAAADAIGRAPLRSHLSGSTLVVGPSGEPGELWIGSPQPFDVFAGRFDRGARTLTGAIASADRPRTSYQRLSEGGVLAYSRDGRLRASADGAGGVLVEDLRSGARATVGSGGSAVTALAFDFSGERVAIGGSAGRVRVAAWRADEVVLDAEAHPGRVYALAFSPDGARLASGGVDHLIRLFDLADRAPIAALEGHENYVHALAFDPAGERLASSGGDGRVVLWDTRDRRATWLTARAARERRARMLAELAELEERLVGAADPAQARRAWAAADPDPDARLWDLLRAQWPAVAGSAPIGPDIALAPLRFSAADPERSDFAPVSIDAPSDGEIRALPGGELAWHASTPGGLRRLDMWCAERSAAEMAHLERAGGVLTVRVDGDTDRPFAASAPGCVYLVTPERRWRLRFGRDAGGHDRLFLSLPTSGYEEVELPPPVPGAGTVRAIRVELRPGGSTATVDVDGERVADAWRPMGPHAQDYPGLLFGIVGGSAGGVSFVEVTLEPHE